MRFLTFTSQLVMLLGLTVTQCLIIPTETKIHEISVGGTNLKISPKLSEDGKVILYTLDPSGTFHRYSTPPKPEPGEVTYSVLKNGILAPISGPYALIYDITRQGDIVPRPSNKCMYKSDKTAFYVEGLQNTLIPVEIFHSGDKIYYIYDGRLMYSELIAKSNENQDMSLKIKPDIIIPDKSCCGDIILFLLKSNGVFARNPPDEYLPNGMKLKYRLQPDGSLSPQLSKNSDGLELTYETAENGNLSPCDSNSHTLTTTNEATKSYILGQGGILAPVSEVMGLNKTISYFYDGHLIHSSNQFRKVFTNSSVVYLTERSKNTTETEISTANDGPKFTCGKRIAKRDIRGSFPEEDDDFAKKQHKSPMAYAYGDNEKSCKTSTAFAYDDNGKKIVLEPYISDSGKVAIFKLTCKGQLQRLDMHEEPEYGFPVYFKLLDNCILVPTQKLSGRVLLKYLLLQNGSLMPVRGQKCTLKKAPASLMYFMLAKNLELLPVRLNILKCDHVDIHYQDSLIYTMTPAQSKDLEIFTNLYAPLCAIFNGKTIIVHSDPVPKPKSGSTWSNPNRSGEAFDYECKNLYLIGPNNTRIKIEPFVSSNNGIVIYEMDSDGVCHKSPRDDNKNLGLRSFMLLKDGILLQANKSNGYLYLVDKQGNMMPCCYPETKLRAPHGLTVKYLFCKNGVYLPILIEALQDHIRFSYENHVVYWRRAYTICEIIERWGDCSWSEKPDDGTYVKENGCFVYFERNGDCFQRHPNKKVVGFMVKHTGFLSVMPCGKLVPVTPDGEHEKKDCIGVQLRDNGDVCIISSTGAKPDRKNYLLSNCGELVPVDVTEKDGIIKFYINGVKIGKQRLDCWKECELDQVEDPMDLYESPVPEKKEATSPQYVPVKFDDPKKRSKWNEHDLKKCKQIRECFVKMAKKATCANMDIQTNPELTRDIMYLMRLCMKGEKCGLLNR